MASARESKRLVVLLCPISLLLDVNDVVDSRLLSGLSPSGGSMKSTATSAEFSPEYVTTLSSKVTVFLFFGLDWIDQ
jgi:hypothetical protein